jgi:T5SS/PEP-CTERM-associated repeat protein
LACADFVAAWRNASLESRLASFQRKKGNSFPTLPSVFVMLLRRRVCAGLFALVAVTQGPALAHGATRNWTNNLGGPFLTFTNWDGGVPGGNDIAVFRRGNVPNYSVGINGPLNTTLPFVLEQLVVGANSVTFSTTSGSTLTLDHAGVSETTRALVVGSLATDAPAMLNTSLPALNAVYGTLGSVPDANGTLNVTGGTFNVTGSGATYDLIVGHGGTGAVNANGGAVNVAGDAAAGLLAGSSGTISITGAGSTWTGNSQVYRGEHGIGVLNISEGGQMNNALDGIVAAFAGSAGTATISGVGSTWNNTGDWYVGREGNGTATISSSAVVASSRGYIGQLAGSQGEVVLEGPAPGGASSRWNSTGALTVGQAGKGALKLYQGSLVANSDAYVAFESGSIGTVLVTGASSPGAASTWDNSGNLYVGYAGNGTLTIADGGRVESGHAYVGYVAGGSGAVLVSGPASSWQAAGFVYVGSSAPGSLTVNNFGGSPASGGVSASDFDVGFEGVLKGFGFLSGAVQNSGLVAPGDSWGSLDIYGAYSQSAAGKLEIELGGTTPASQYDQLKVHESATLNGTLEVKLAGSFVPEANATFDILDWGSLSGTFSTVELPTLPAGRAWDMSQLYATGALRVVGMSPADFEEDGDVDGGDLLKWQAGYGTSGTGAHGSGDADGDLDVDGADLLAWQRELGAAAEAAIVTTIPEPSALAIVVAGLMGVLRRKRRAD